MVGSLALYVCAAVSLRGAVVPVARPTVVRRSIAQPIRYVDWIGNVWIDIPSQDGGTLF